MSDRHSALNRARWKKVPKEKRSAMMSEIAKKRMSKLSPEARRKIACKLVRAREAKRASLA